MTIQWVGTTGETADTNIYFASGAPTFWNGGFQVAKTKTSPYPKTDFKIFRTELTGLKPGTDYQFRIGRQSPTYRFRTMPAKATDTIQFISGGDCGVNTHAVANNIQAARQDPMFALIGGDLGYDNGKSVEMSLGFHPQLQQAHGRREGPADPDGRLHRQPRGRRRLRQAANGSPVLLRPVRRAVSAKPVTRRSTSATT